MAATTALIESQESLVQMHLLGIASVYLDRHSHTIALSTPIQGEPKQGQRTILASHGIQPIETQEAAEPDARRGATGRSRGALCQLQHSVRHL